MSTTTITNIPFIFKDNQTFLNNMNWTTYFKKMIQTGFFSHFVRWDTSSDKLKLNNFTANIKGSYGTGDSYSMGSIDPVTQSEVDCYIYISYDGVDMKLWKVTNISSNTTAALKVLSEIMWAMYVGPIYDMFEIPIGGGHYMPLNIPVAYGIYNKGFWDLSRLFSIDGGFYEKINMSDANYSSHVVNSPYCGHIAQYGLAQIYGSHKYDIDIADDYSQSEFLLYPVPVCSLDPASIYIKNETSGAVTIKLPLTYRDMYFDYFTDNNWTESSGFLTYSLAAGSEMAITMHQISQDSYYSGDIDYPKSFYTVSQLVKSA